MLCFIGFCITRARIGDMCPLNSFALECVTNSLTASLCQCDEGFIQSNKSGNLTSGSDGGENSTFDHVLNSGSGDFSGDNDSTSLTCMGKPLWPN